MQSTEPWRKLGVFSNLKNLMNKSYKKIASHEASIEEAKHVLLLYSGGLDTSVMLKWIKDEYQAEITTLTVDIGQQGDFELIKQKAINLGVKEAILIDAKEEFANSYITKAIKANASYQGDYHLFCPLGRAIISQIAVKIAQEKNIPVIAHGCTGKGNDQVRFEGYITTLDPTLKTIAPVREWAMGRDEEIAYAIKNNIPIPQTKKKPYSYDDNLWGCSAEGGEIEDFEKGIPTKINGEPFTLKDLISTLNKLGSEHGIGITYLIEDRLIGLKVRGIYEQPAAAIITEAHKNLEKLVSTRDQNEFKQLIDQKWSYFCYGAKWHEPLMEALNSSIDKINEKVTGEVSVKLYKGKVTITAVSSPFSLINKNLSTFMKDDLFNQNASAGFIELYTLQQRMAKKVSKQAHDKMEKPDLRF